MPSAQILTYRLDFLSVDLCERVPQAINKGKDSYLLISEKVSVSTASAHRIARKLRHGSSFEPAPRLVRPTVLEEIHNAFILETMRRTRVADTLSKLLI